MTSTTRESDILKQDARGRVLVSAVRREALLDEFARLAGIKYSTFANWVQGRRRRRALVQPPEHEAEAADGLAESGGPVRLFEALVEGGPGGCGEVQRAEGGVIIELPGGCRLSVGSPAELPMAAELVALIAQAVRARC